MVDFFQDTPLALSLAPEKLPLVPDPDGVIRVGGTRVTLDTIVAAFLDGASAEVIVDQYPSLDLADVYAVIGYFLHHRQEVEAYLKERDARSVQVRLMNEARFDPAGVRARLMSRRPGEETTTHNTSGGG
jgi:uncharacterized protein (DUF433 family)